MNPVAQGGLREVTLRVTQLSMPWRAGQVYGHLRRTALLHASTPRIVVCRSLLVKPLHHSIPSRWPAAAAALSVRIPSVRQLRDIEDVRGPGGDVVLRGRAAHVPRGESDTTDTHLQVHLEAAIDGMFLRLSETGSLPDAAGNSGWAYLRTCLREPGQVVTLAVKLSRTREPHRVLRVLALAHMLGCKLKQHGYESMAYHLSRANHWSVVTSLVELARLHSGHTTLRLLNWRARALVNLQDFAALDRVLDIFEQEKVRPDRRTFHIIIAGHLRNRDLARAKRCLASMEEAGIEADESTHSLIIASYRPFGLAKSVQTKALDILYETDAHSATNIVNSLVQQCLDKEDIEGAMRHFALFDTNTSSMPSTGGYFIHPDGDLQPKESTDVHNDRTPLQDAHTFTILINYFAKQGDLRRALHILGRMQESGIEPDSSTAAALVHAYFSGGEAVKAVHIVASLCRARDVPSEFFRQLGLTTSQARNPSLLPTGLPLTVELFNALIRGSLATHGIQGMASVLGIMRWCDVKPDETTAHILLLYLDRVEGASLHDIMRHFRHLVPVQVIPTIQHLNVILTSIVRRETHLRREMDRKPVESSAPSEDGEAVSQWDRISGTMENSYDPTAGLEIPRWLSSRTQAQPILDSMSVRDVRSDRATYALRIRHDAVIKRDLAMAKESFQAMINRGLHPNKYHFAAVMEGYAIRGDVDGAMAVMDSALKEGIRPNVEMYTILITACSRSRSKQPRRAFRIFHAMLDKGIQPDVLCVLALTWSFFVDRQTGEARRILLQLLSTVVDMPDGLDTTAPLKDLMQAFASQSTDRKPLSRQRARMLRWKVNDIIRRWSGAWPRRDTLHSSKSDAATAVPSHPPNVS
ncbi:hypothetical protein C8Q72DRAFT_400084 [Fomitopsis betulina]|nr:hypothetical protein C8Q72DRAFT_400084 [Fomitopsis betulina]